MLVKPGVSPAGTGYFPALGGINTLEFILCGDELPGFPKRFHWQLPTSGPEPSFLQMNLSGL